MPWPFLLHYGSRSNNAESVIKSIFAATLVVILIFSNFSKTRVRNGRLACGGEVLGGDGAPFNPDWKVLDHNVPRSSSVNFVLNL